MSPYGGWLCFIMAKVARKGARYRIALLPPVPHPVHRRERGHPEAILINKCFRSDPRGHGDCLVQRGKRTFFMPPAAVGTLKNVGHGASFLLGVWCVFHHTIIYPINRRKGSAYSKSLQSVRGLYGGVLSWRRAKIPFFPLVCITGPGPPGPSLPVGYFVRNRFLGSPHGLAAPPPGSFAPSRCSGAATWRE